MTSVRKIPIQSSWRHAYAFGHCFRASLREIERYTKAAEQEKHAWQAIARLIRNASP